MHQHSVYLRKKRNKKKSKQNIYKIQLKHIIMEHVYIIMIIIIINIQHRKKTRNKQRLNYSKCNIQLKEDISYDRTKKEDISLYLQRRLDILVAHGHGSRPVLVAVDLLSSWRSEVPHQLPLLAEFCGEEPRHHSLLFPPSGCGHLF